MRKAAIAVIAGLSFLGMFKHADAWGVWGPDVRWQARPFSTQGIPSWIPPACYQYGPCSPVVATQRWSTQLLVQNRDNLMLFGFEYVPGKSQNGQAWACADLRLQMMPIARIFQGRCLFIAGQASIQPIDDYDLEPMR